MRALVQRVSEASVLVEGHVTGEIKTGLLVFLGIRADDGRRQAEHLAEKLIRLRIFPDSNGKMNKSLADIAGEMLVISQFTLYGDTRNGNRPSYSEAATSDFAEPIYEYFVQFCRNKLTVVQAGVFGANMQVRLTNEGPVTLMCYAEN